MLFSVTLGDFQFSSKEYLKRREPADLFEKDPFKIHSYNFRYANKPALSVPPWLPKDKNANKVNSDCQTFFYNYDYPNTNVSIQTSSPLANDVRGLNLTKFQEYRRKKLFQESEPIRLQEMTNNNLATTSKSAESKILNIDKGSQSSKSSPLTLLKKPIYMPSYCYENAPNSSNILQNVQICKAQTQPSILNQNKSSLVHGIDIKRSRSLGSTCDININIKNLDTNTQRDSVNIKIASDSLCRNLNPGSTNLQNNLNCKADSSNAFDFDKHLSKFRLRQKKSQEASRKTDADRIKDLTAIYSSQVLKKPKRNTSSYDRIPSIIPFTNSNTMRNNNNNSLNLTKNNFTRSKSMIEKSKNDISISTLKNSPYDILTSSTKRLQSLSPSNLNSSRRSSSGLLNKSSYKSATIPLKIGNVPINVNINLYTDNSKGLKF